jgi:ribosomal protein S5
VFGALGAFDVLGASSGSSSRENFVDAMGDRMQIQYQYFCSG